MYILTLVCLTKIFIQGINYHDHFSQMTAKCTLYSVDLNLNDNVSWKKESTWFDSADQSIGMSACNKHDYRPRYLSKITQEINSLLLGQLVQFKGMLIGIYKSREFFHTKHFGLVFSRNFTQSQIKQKIEDGQPLANDVSRSFHVAIVH